MSIRVVCIPESVVNSNSVLPPPAFVPGTYAIIIQYAGLDLAHPVTDSTVVYNVAAETSDLGVLALIQGAVKADIIAKYKYVFAPNDTVKVI